MERYSVLMSVYYKERAEYLRLSMQSMIDQSIPPEQFVLVCDGPLTPELNEVIAEFQGAYPQLYTVVHLERNVGIGVALNIGIQHCRNELVARMGADDIAVKDRMEMQLAELKKYPQISVLGGQIAEFYDTPDEITGYRQVPISEEKIRERIKFRNPMNHMTVVLRKSHVLSVGNYQDVPGFEDYFLWSSLTANGCSLRNIKAVCCVVRANAGMYVREGQYICLGDNTYQYETVLPEYCIALVTAIRRGDKVISTDSVGYKLYSRVWVTLYPLRRCMYLAYRRLRTFAKKLLKKGSR